MHDSWSKVHIKYITKNGQSPKKYTKSTLSMLKKCVSPRKVQKQKIYESQKSINKVHLLHLKNVQVPEKYQ